MKLHPVSYKWKENSHNRTHTGFIAQAVETDLGAQEASDWGFFIKSPGATEEKLDEEGKVVEVVQHPDTYGLRYTELISPIVGAIQCLADRLTLQEQLSGPTPPLLERQIACGVACVDCALLTNKVTALETRIVDLEAYLSNLSMLFKK